MAMIPLGEAASRLGLSSKQIEEWANKGLLHIRTADIPSHFPPAWVTEQQVDEEELAQVAESLGWLQVSAENWDDVEGE
jgi:hypothetical protein